MILDEGWAVNKQADLMQVVPEIDLEELVEYGRERNVGIILWAGYYAFERDMERVVKHYADMGVKGFKVDFMDRDDQRMVDFLHRAAEVCAEHKMLLDFHGVFKPTGLNRTWPNVLNYEGVFGLEQLKWSAESTDMVKYDVTMPFIRMVAGPMDYTQGAMRNASRGNYRPVHSEPMSQGTRCRQLAEYVVFESPITMLCDSPSNYMKEPECFAFMASVPTVWDETVALTGSVGEYIAIARRSGDTWYIGAMTDWTPRELELDLSFIGNGNYDVESFADGINAATGKRINKSMISRWENDRDLPTVDNAIALARFFGCTLEYLGNGTPEGEMNNDQPRKSTPASGDPRQDAPRLAKRVQRRHAYHVKRRRCERLHRRRFHSAFHRHILSRQSHRP